MSFGSICRPTQFDLNLTLIGTWGCGAYRSDGTVIAALCRKALPGDFKGG